jgi:hypothetical protein
MQAWKQKDTTMKKQKTKDTNFIQKHSTKLD